MNKEFIDQRVEEAVKKRAELLEAIKEKFRASGLFTEPAIEKTMEVLQDQSGAW